MSSNHRQPVWGGSRLWIGLTILVVLASDRATAHSRVLDHHYRRCVCREGFEHMGQVRRITDVVARMQQHGSAGRAHVCAASAQHHVLDRARGVGLRKTRLAGLHLQSVYIALRAGRQSASRVAA